MPQPLIVFAKVFQILFSFLWEWWWVLAPVILISAFVSLWKTYIRLKYLKSLEWSFLEVKIPKLILKTPKAMEHIFSSLHAIAEPITWFGKTFHGVTQNWISFEIVGIEGATHFFIRTLKQFKNFTEAQIYAQYPDAEISEVRDYVSLLPNSIPNAQYDFWGAEMELTKADAYPIRVYQYFEENVEERRTDPLSSLTEFFAKLRGGEQVWIQYVIRPAGDKWKKAGEELVNKLTGKETPQKKSKGLFEVLGDVLAPSPAGVKKPEERREKSQMVHLSPRQRDVVKAIEENISKLGFEATIRFMYVADRAVFDRYNITGVVGFFKQFNTLDMNGLDIDEATATSARFLFVQQRKFMKKRNFYRKYLWRVPSGKFVLNTEELATVCHFPAASVFSPMLPKIHAKRGEPPAGLPIAE